MREIVLKISGSITIGDTDSAIHHQVRRALDDHCKIIIIDLEKVTYMDSSGVGELAASYTSARNKGARLGLVKLQPKIRKLLQIMCFLDLFQIFDSIEDAQQILRDQN